MGNQLVSKIILQISKARSWRWKLKKCKQFDNDPMEHGAWVFNSLHFVDTFHTPLTVEMKHFPRGVHHNLLQNATK